MGGRKGENVMGFRIDEKQRTQGMYVRVRKDDHERMKELAEKHGCQLALVVREAIHFALENMDED
jgi:predicted DNA-binding protein